LTPQSFQTILGFLTNGQVLAWVAEFPDSKILAADQATTIIKLKNFLKRQLKNTEYVVIEVDREARSIDTFLHIPILENLW
jgi:hypothetical protein